MKETYRKILGSAHYILGRKMHTTFEIRQKLLKKYPDNEDIIKTIIKECEEVHLINDKHYAEEFVCSRLSLKPKGRKMLAFELKKKGISNDIIEEVLAKITDEDEEKNAEKIAVQKLKILSGEKNMQKKREKIFRFLVSRGFDFSLTKKIVEKVLEYVF